MIHTVFAVDKFGGMGFNGTLPWPHNSEDLAHFKALTTGHVVVMGRATWDDPKLPKPLPGRTVYVATNRSLPNNSGASVISGDIKSQLLALEAQHPDKIIWVIGGPTLIAQCDGIIDKMYVTHHKYSYKADSRVDLRTLLLGWHALTGTAAPNSNCAFVTYVPIFKRSVKQEASKSS